MNEDKARPNCAVVGIFNHPKASYMAYYALHALQHRGQEASGITTVYYDQKANKKKYAFHRGEGLVFDVFSNQKVFTDVLVGDSAIGHNRYSTTGSSSKVNIQPFNMIFQKGILSIAHNGNLTNTRILKDRLQGEGSIFQTTTDTEIFLHLIARSKQATVLDQLREALRQTLGAYSLAILTEDSLIAARDPHGVRPLNIGRKLNDDGTYAYFIASESVAFDIVSAEYVRQVEHNEIVVFNGKTRETGEFESHKILDETPEAHHCIFEYIYFSRPDSKIFGHNVDKVRRKLGKNLAEESPVKPDKGGKTTVIAVPDSGNTATLGYSRVNSKIAGETLFEIGLIRSHYVGRTFIAPGQDNRQFKVKAKFNPVKGVLEDRKLVFVDDSIVRGTTSKSLVKLLREAKPKELHCRITSPPIKYPCHYGMDFPSSEELIANHYNSQEEIGKAIGVDSLKYLSIQKLLESVPQDEGVSYCTACFTGDYPIPFEKDSNKHSAE